MHHKDMQELRSAAEKEKYAPERENQRAPESAREHQRAPERARESQRAPERARESQPSLAYVA